MTSDSISITAEVDADAAKALLIGLDQFNESHNGPDPTEPLWALCRDAEGRIAGGLQGFVQWDWFVVSILWIREDRRGQGLGSRLLAEAEEAARQRGCVRARLETMTYQAPEFYKRFGYREIGRLPDMPPGHDYIWMTKTL